MAKDVTKLIREIKSWPGWRVEDRGRSFMVYPADKAHGPITIHKTPSDHRWLHNTTAQLRRAGGPI